MRIIDLMSKWVKQDGVILTPDLRARVSKFLFDSAFSSSDSSVVCHPSFRNLWPKIQNSEGAEESDQQTTSSGSMPDHFTISIYKIKFGVAPYDIFYYYTPREFAEQVTIIARSYYVQIKQWCVLSASFSATVYLHSFYLHTLSPFHPSLINLNPSLFVPSVSPHPKRSPFSHRPPILQTPKSNPLSALLGLWWSKPDRIALASPITSLVSHIDKLAEWAGTVIAASVVSSSSWFNSLFFSEQKTDFVAHHQDLLGVVRTW